MPRYVFEVTVTLPSGEAMPALELDLITVLLEAELEQWLVAQNHKRYEIGHDDPFEHVTGDWLPPDENGNVKVGPSRSIDL